MLKDPHPARGDRYRLPSKRVVVVTRITARDVCCVYEDDGDGVSFRRGMFDLIAWMLRTEGLNNTSCGARLVAMQQDSYPRNV